MKVSQELSILFCLRHKNKSSENKASIMVRLTLDGERTDFSLGWRPAAASGLTTFVAEDP